MVDIFYNLNHEHLSKQHKTIHEILKDKGIQSASINALLYRGSYATQLKIPFLLSLFTGLKRELNSYAPNLYSYGAMHKLNPLKLSFGKSMDSTINFLQMNWHIL